MQLHPQKILIFSYDWRNLFDNDFSQLVLKMNRDRLATEFNYFFIISWSNKTYYKKNKNLETVHLYGLYLLPRFIYDFLLILISPIIIAINNFKSDYIYVREFPLLAAAIAIKMIFGSKIVFFLGSMPKDLALSRNWGKIKKIYYVLCEKFLKNFVDIYLANGEATKNYLINIGINEKDIKIMVEDVIERDSKLINSSQKGLTRAVYDIIDSKKIILSVGRLEKEKGFERLIKAFANINNNDYVLIIVGEGVLKEDLLKLIIDLKLSERVILTGYIDRKKIWNFYRDADIFVLLSYSEGNPTVIREAMYMGVPVIGSNIKPIMEFINADGDRGFIWDEQMGFDSFDEKVKLCLSDSLKTGEMVNRAKEYIDNNIKGNLIINNFFN